MVNVEALFVAKFEAAVAKHPRCSSAQLYTIAERDTTRELKALVQSISGTHQRGEIKPVVAETLVETPVVATEDAALDADGQTIDLSTLDSSELEAA